MFFTDFAQLSRLTGSGVGKDDVQLERHFAFNASKHVKLQEAAKAEFVSRLNEPYDE
jgi:hypothetical protein